MSRHVVRRYAPPTARDAPCSASAWPEPAKPREEAPMATVEEGLPAQIRNIGAAYGKPMREWLAIVAASCLTKHTEVVAMLKNDYGMTHGAAHRVSPVARQAAAPPAGPGQDADPASALYTGRKASLRPVHDALMSAVTTLGDDIEVAPKKATSACGAASSSR
jgi:Domain of unknown function (DUF4287)